MVYNKKNTETILVVDDEKDILDLVAFHLKKQGFNVLTSLSGEEALDLLKATKPDLIILDLMLPGIDGIEIAKIIKARPELQDISIIMLTAKGDETDIVVGFELGADDYVTKPFSPKVLVARVKTLLKRKRPQMLPTEYLKVAGIEIFPSRHEVLVDGDPISLTLTEYKILYCLANKPGWVYTRYQIVDHVHGADYAVTDRTVDVLISSLRKKLGKYGRMIETVRGVGYKLRPTL